MATVSITVPDGKANKVYDAFDRAYGDATESPTTNQKIAFVKSKIIDYITDLVYADESNSAANTARDGVTKDNAVAS